MSGSARRRGQIRGQYDDISDASPRLGFDDRTSRLRVSVYDGPASRGTGSAAGSQGGRASNAPSSVGGQPQGSITPQGSQAGSRRATMTQPPIQTAGPVAGLDPARSAPQSHFETMKNIDLPASCYSLDYKLETRFSRRPAFNTTGKAFNLPVNSYQVTSYPSKTIYQYDVLIGNGAEKRAVIHKVWESKTRQAMTGLPAIFDGNKIAWSLKDYGDELRKMVDLDAEEGRKSRGDKNTFRLHIRRARVLDVSIIEQYLSGRVQFSIKVAEAVNFMDHLLRQGPSVNPNMVAVKRSFFIRGCQRQDLGGGIEVFRGIYQTMRLAEGKKLVINLDVSNTCFWKPGNLITLILGKTKYRDANHLLSSLKNKDIARATLKFINKLTVKSSYQGNKLPNKEWKIAGLSDDTANSCRIDWRDPQTGQETGEKVTIAAYFKRRYNVTIVQSNLPLVTMTKKNVKFPMELLTVVPNQRYSSKLDEIQTAAMIKFAVSPPSIRSKSIEEGKGWLDWQGDAYLRNYGLSVDKQQIVTQARILPPPGVLFGRGKIEQPGTKGRWDLRGKAFFSPNPRELVSWGIGIFPGRVNLDTAGIQKFALDFAKAYKGHGGSVANGLPAILKLPADVGEAANELWKATGNKFNKMPQLLIFLVQDRNSQHYLRIKKNSDCRFGVVSQVMQAAQVSKGNPQYYSNVLMKVNAKLGGCTSKVQPAKTSGFQGFKNGTMFIGADVSHASPGSEQASMAAITVSLDGHAGRYGGACQTNGYRVEMITDNNMYSMLGPLAQQWASTVGSGRAPSQVYYMRDGVSEGQFSQVIQQEIPSIRKVLDKIAQGSWKGKLTVVIASKRHHIRAFPKQGDGDQKGNPLPGTLVERDVTMPNEWDFYLYSHIALQGTSRPVHYTVIHDEAGHSPNELQNMIYEHCYQYMRSTTSVSLHPAVYYAHLASNRARAHEDVAASAGPTGGAGYKVNQPRTEQTKNSEPDPLIKMNPQCSIQVAMWYI